MIDQRHSLTLGDLLREHRRSRGRLLAAVDGDMRLTYRELDDRANRLSSSLGSAGVGPGSRVLWVGQNSFRVLELLLAAAKLGASVVPANWRQSSTELAFVLDDLDPDVVVWQREELESTIDEARGMAATRPLWLQHDAEGDGSYEAFLAAGGDSDPQRSVDVTSPVVGIYTAAFEGHPNCALLTHLGVYVESLAVARLNEISDETVFLNSGPLFHVGTLATTLATFVFGGTNVFLARTDAEEICRLVERERCNRAFIMGPTVEQIREVNRDGRYDVTSLWGSQDPRAWTMCTPSMQPTTGRSGSYGQTEIGGLTTSYGLGQQAQSTYGRPLPVAQVRIVTEDGTECDVGEVGEIVVRGPVVMAGYHNRPNLNAERSREGWHRTNDLGRREPDGSIGFVGPKTRMIKSAAENIYPIEVERCIAALDGVEDVCVIGVPDERWTQAVKALVVLAPGARVDAADLVEHCRNQIGSYKKPRIVEFVDALPRTATGQVDRDLADELFGGGGYPGQVSSSAREIPLQTS